jgi:hypothetical protein
MSMGCHWQTASTLNTDKQANNTIKVASLSRKGQLLLKAKILTISHVTKNILHTALDKLTK